MSGYVDLQVNGYAGVDFNGDGVTPDDFHEACARLESDGVSRILATIITDDVSAMARRLAAIVVVGVVAVPRKVNTGTIATNKLIAHVGYGIATNDLATKPHYQRAGTGASIGKVASCIASALKQYVQRIAQQRKGVVGGAKGGTGN